MTYRALYSVVPSVLDLVASTKRPDETFASAGISFHSKSLNVPRFMRFRTSSFFDSFIPVGNERS